MLRKWSKRAQSTAEYAILIAVVVGAVVAMQIYVRRGLQGRVKDVVDFTGDAKIKSADGTETDLFSTTQYEPYYVSSAAKSDNLSSVTEDMQKGGSITKTIEGEEVSRMSRKQEIGWDANADLEAPELE
ncbi:MAG: hypothetical protein ABIH18_08180 [Candidatus Omnitrophota bacterium]